MGRRDVIYFTTDDNYVDLATVAIFSLQCQYTDKDILVFTTSEQAKIKLDSVHKNIKTVLLPEYTINFNQRTYTKKAADSMCTRLVALEYLKEHYDRALYMDVDVFVQKNIDHLFDMDLTGYDIAACRDTQYNNSYKVLGDERTRRINICGAYENYINSGLLLIDLTRIVPPTIQSISETTNDPDFCIPDQDYIANKYKIKFIDSTYNKTFECYYQHYMTPEEMRTHYLMSEQAHVVHYILGTKPYNNFTDAMYRMVPIERYLRFVILMKKHLSPEFVNKCIAAYNRYQSINIRIPVRVKNVQYRLDLKPEFRGLT